MIDFSSAIRFFLIGGTYNNRTGPKRLEITIRVILFIFILISPQMGSNKMAHTKS